MAAEREVSTTCVSGWDQALNKWGWLFDPLTQVVLTSLREIDRRTKIAP